LRPKSLWAFCLFVCNRPRRFTVVSCEVRIKSAYKKVKLSYVRFEVLPTVTMKNGVFWDVTPCDSCNNRRFGGTQCLHNQGDKNRLLVRLTLFLVHRFLSLWWWRR
jgi:hypothetical protein